MSVRHKSKPMSFLRRQESAHHVARSRIKCGMTTVVACGMKTLAKCKLTALLAMAILLFTAPAFAQQTPAPPPTEPSAPISHTPDFCEFSAKFPSAPYTTRRCEDADTQERCYDQISYTQVFDMISTVNFRLICNKIDKDIYKQYSGDVMQATLRAMTKRSVVQTFDTSFRAEDTYKQAGLVGEGKVGLTPTIYIAQLWMGQTSALSVEAEIIGEPIEAADQMFSDVLRTIGHKQSMSKNDNNETPQPKPAATAY